MFLTLSAFLTDKLNHKTFVLAIVLVAVILISLFAALLWSSLLPENPVFYVGVEMAYKNANVSDVQVLVNKVKNYTNLFVIGSIELTYNETALFESCDYINNAGLKIVVLLTNVSNYSFDTREWLTKAQKKYGDGFIGLYRYDEPGGDQLESANFRFVKDATNYSDAATNFVNILREHVDYYINTADRIFTADFGLYWWDYKTNYSTIFAEFVGNQSRQRHIALCRGAAAAQSKDWGAIVTWKYDKAPFLEDGDALYTDLTTAYAAGAKYIIVFDYPKLDTYGILGDDHFDALKRFWDYSHQNPQAFGSIKADVAYVVPKDYGFGFRSAEGSIWGIFPADALSSKVWNDVKKLVGQYGFALDIIYDEPEVVDTARNRYDQLFFWNETVP
jgi:hypothetical protein